MSGNPACDRVMEYASSYLDRRMSVPARAKYDQHLGSCPSCRSELALLREVSRRVAALPIPPTPHGLADRIRGAARTSSRARSPWRSNARAVAAILVATLTIGGAYFIGVREGRRQGAGAGEVTPAVAQADRVPGFHPERVEGPRVDRSEDLDADPIPNDVAARIPEGVPERGAARIADPYGSPVSYSDEQSLRAAQGLLADLALIDQVPTELRRPLLQAQLDHFGLDDWARRRGDVARFLPIASVLRHLETTLRESPDDLHLADLQRDARAGELWRSFEEARGLPAPDLGPIEGDPNLRYLALDVAPELGEESRRSLGALMRIKDSWVHGRHQSVIDSIQESRPRSASIRSLGPSLPFVAGASFADAGLQRESEALLDPFTADANDWMRSMMDSFLGEIDRARAASNPERRLHDLLLGSDAGSAGGEREIHVEEAFEDGSYSYRVTIRSSSTSSGSSSTSSSDESSDGSSPQSSGGEGPQKGPGGERL